MKFKTHRVADVSTAHMTQADDDLLSNVPAGLLPKLLGRLDHGYLFHTFECEKGAGDLRDHFSEALCNILVEAAKQGIPYVRFDADGATVEGAPTFDW